MTDPFSNISTHDRYATDVRNIESFRRQWHIPASGERLIAMQTVIVDMVPKYEATSLLYGLQEKKLFARIAIHEDFLSLRIFSSQLLSSLGSSENIQSIMNNLQNWMEQHPDEQSQEAAINYITMLDFCNKNNLLIQEIRGNMFRFIHG